MSRKRIARMGSAGRWAGSRRGFTLIEVLIALSVLAVTMTAAFSIFSSGIRVRSATRERMVFDRDVRLLLSALSDDFANLIPTGPRPFVSPDTIVLLRYPRQVPGRETETWVPQLVTYQWSGSALEDSSLIRATIPMTLDLADSALVAREFQKWSGKISDMGEGEPVMIRQEPGARFGARASRNGLSGWWVGYPEIREFGFAVINEMVIDPSDDVGVPREQVAVRLRIRLGSESVSDSGDSDTRFNRVFPGTWGPDNGADVEVGIWIPLVRWNPASLTADLDDWRRS